MEEILKKPWFKALALLAATGLFLWLVYTARGVLTPFIIALGLAYLLDPLVDRMESWRIGRTFAIGSMMAFLALLILGVITVAFPLVLDHVETAVRNMPYYINRLEKVIMALAGDMAWAKDPALGAKVKASIQSYGDLPLKILKALAKGVWSGVSGAMGVAVAFFNLVIIPIATFYLLHDFDHIMAWAAVRVPPRYRQRVFGLARKLDSVLAAFIRGQLTVAFIMASILSVGLLLIGVPMGFFLGLLAGFANIVPYMPVILGYIPALAFSYAGGGGWESLLAVTALFAAAQALEGFVITPKIQGEAVGLHPVAIMAAALAGGVFFGFIGVLLSAPAAAMLKVLLEEADMVYMESELYKGIPDKTGRIPRQQAAISAQAHNMDEVQLEAAKTPPPDTGKEPEQEEEPA